MHPFRFLAISLLLAAPALQADDWEKDFLNPPNATKPRCYWYWMDGVITKEGITKDLEAMKKVGIGEGYIGIITGQGGPGTKDGLKALTDPWWDTVAHAVREGTRLGVDIGLFNSPGWSQSGGPWVKPSQSMRYLVLPEQRVHGPQHFEGKLPAPEGDFQPVATIAFPAPAGDAETTATKGATVTKDGQTVTLEMKAPFTARSLTVRPKAAVNVRAELQVSDDGKAFRPVRSFSIDRHNLGAGVGPVPLAPVVVAMPATTARYFRLALSAASDIGEVELSPAPRVDTMAEKTLIKVFQDPLPPFDFYSWPPQPEPESPDLVVAPNKVVDLKDKVSADGTLRWDVPAGDWIVVRAGMVPTGTRNSPAPPEATGPEVDKMNRAALKLHFDAYVGELYRRLAPAERKSWKHVVADSYEMGPQNWTDGFALEFQKQYGYDPLPWLPVLGGRLVGSADQSNRFLWDLRRLVAERVARDYVGGLRDLCNQKNLRMWLENYGHWGFPSEFLLYGGYCDEISGEFWEAGSLGNVELRAAASAAHTYGKPQVFAEAFTGGPAFRSTPWSLKKRGDWALCQGINQFVLHVYIHQPWEDRRPGVTAWFGTEFNRHNTWFEAAKPWVDYQRRCSVLLQAGVPVADVAYFIGEDAPKMTGLCDPVLPPGYDFDYINSDVLLNKAEAKDGRLQLPQGPSYRLLVLPPLDSMRPEVMRKIAALVRGGVTVCGPQPVRSPSLQGYPDCDLEIRKATAGLWGEGRIRPPGDLGKMLVGLGTPPDLSGVDPSNILFVHRRLGTKHAYFLSNQTDSAVAITPVFRVSGLAPESWDPVSGAITRLAVYDEADGRTTVPLHLPPRGSVFVVFREAGRADRITEVRREGEVVLATKATVVAAPAAEAPGNFTMACWARPSTDTPMFPEANQGVVGVNADRNDAALPMHGDSIIPGGGHAGSGFSVGRNGVCVCEHGANYFAPVLVHPATLTGWTHVAVVYRDGTPTLYLDGKPARTGKKGSRIPHPSPFGAPFRGELANCQQVPRAVAENEIAAWAATRPGPAPWPDVFALDQNGKLEALLGTPGRYELRAAGGKSTALTVPALPVPLEIDGPWDVRFSTPGGQDLPVRFETLQSWADRPEPAVKFHSGRADYERTFDLPASLVAAGRRLFLDLGQVESIAEVTVNDRPLGTLWGDPYQVDATKALRAGPNRLRVRVWNTWHNRLLGEKQAPAGLAGAKAFATTWPKSGPGDALMPSGLIGPVSLRPVAVTLPEP